jgi:hypothetical protein
MPHNSDERNSIEFMVTMRPYAAHKVSRALTALTPGIDFGGCSKGHMAEAWASAANNPRCNYADTRLARTTLEQIENKVIELYGVPR